MNAVLIAALLLVLVGVAVVIVRFWNAADKTGRSPWVNTPVRDVAKLVEGMGTPAIVAEPMDDKVCFGFVSHFGGLPPESRGFTWPQFDGRPLDFLARVCLQEVPPEFDWLPRTGSLLFFYDASSEHWGFDPKDRGAWRVIYVRDEDVLDGEATPVTLQNWKPLKDMSIRFERAMIPPDFTDDRVAALELTDKEHDALVDLRYAMSCHQLGGRPADIQDSDMAMACQFVTHGLSCGDGRVYNSPEAQPLKPGAADWRLLFQIDSDDDVGFMWGDAGMLYFWVREQDARRGDFSNVWMILQCH